MSDRLYPRTCSAGGGAESAESGEWRVVRGWDGRRRRALGGDSRGVFAGRALGGIRPGRLGAGGCGQALGPVWQPAGAASRGVCRLGQALGQAAVRRGAAGSWGEFTAAGRGGAGVQFSIGWPAGYADGSASAGDGGATGQRTRAGGVGGDFLEAGRRAKVTSHRPGDC